MGARVREDCAEGTALEQRAIRINNSTADLLKHRLAGDLCPCAALTKSNPGNPIGLRHFVSPYTQPSSQADTMAASDSIRFPIANYIFIRWIHSITHSRCTPSWGQNLVVCCCWCWCPFCCNSLTPLTAHRGKRKSCLLRENRLLTINYNRVRMTVNIKQWLLPAWTDCVIDFDGDYCRFMAVMIQMPARRLETNRNYSTAATTDRTCLLLSSECSLSAVEPCCHLSSTSRGSWSGRRQQQQTTKFCPQLGVHLEWVIEWIHLMNM